MYCDNQSAISVAENPVMHDKAKHIALKYHYIHNLVENNTVTMHYCPSNANPTDLLTKVLPCDTTSRLCHMMAWTLLVLLDSAIKGSVVVVTLLSSPDGDVTVTWCLVWAGYHGSWCIYERPAADSLQSEENGRR
jgi:hypothetical protein